MLETNAKIIKHKVGLLNLAEELGNVSRACKTMGLSRDTFYRYKAAVESGGVESLFDRSRRQPDLKEPGRRVDRAGGLAPCHRLSGARPSQGLPTGHKSNELRKAGVIVSPSGVRSIWLRNAVANFKGRLKALEAKVAGQGLVLTEAQVAALEKKRQDDEFNGETDTAHPGYLDPQGTLYAGTFKGVGRVYQQAFVDTYSKAAFAKLYPTKTPSTAADLLNDKVLPFFEAQQLPVLRILTDRGTGYCGRAESHDYPLYLATNDIEHTRTKVKSPQTNGICERFHLCPVGTRPYCRSPIRSPWGNTSTTAWKPCRNTWTTGWDITIMAAPIKVKCGADGHRWRHCKMAKPPGRKSF